jgi:hypothetical protein
LFSAEPDPEVLDLGPNRAISRHDRHTPRTHDAEQCREYLAEGGSFPERRHITALIAAFAAEFLLLTERWTRVAAVDAGLTPGARQLLEQVVATVEGSVAA